LFSASSTAQPALPLNFFFSSPATGQPAPSRWPHFFLLPHPAGTSHSSPSHTTKPALTIPPFSLIFKTKPGTKEPIPFPAADLPSLSPEHPPEPQKTTLAHFPSQPNRFPHLHRPAFQRQPTDRQSAFSWPHTPLIFLCEHRASPSQKPAADPPPQTETATSLIWLAPTASPTAAATTRRRDLNAAAPGYRFTAALCTLQRCPTAGHLKRRRRRCKQKKDQR
jgi:hypothetical protein